MADMVNISWEEVEAANKHAALIFQQTFKTHQRRAILGVSRGGLIPAALLAHTLSVPLVGAIIAKSYDDQANTALKVCNVDVLSGPSITPYLMEHGEGIVIVDDLVDSGRTFQTIRKELPKACYISLFNKPNGRPHTDISPIAKPQDQWLVFPWER